MRIERELMRGAGPVAVMQLLEEGEKYGYELVKRLEKQSKGVLAMGQSTLYPMLYNLEAKGLVVSRVDMVADACQVSFRFITSGALYRRIPANATIVEPSGRVG